MLTALITTSLILSDISTSPLLKIQPLLWFLTKVLGRSPSPLDFLLKSIILSLKTWTLYSDFVGNLIVYKGASTRSLTELATTIPYPPQLVSLVLQ